MLLHEDVPAEAVGNAGPKVLWIIVGSWAVDASHRVL